MKPITRILLFFSFFLLFHNLFAETAKQIVKKSNDLVRASSSIGEMSLEVVKPDWSRKMTMKVWALEPDYALVLITKPAKDKGTVTLKREKEVWNWIPAVRRVIKIPPSMMLQSWMGSDFTNDDLIRQSSIVEDYEHSIIGKEKFDGYNCYKIKLTPKPDAGVVWGKILMWISKDSYLQLKTEFYDEDDYLIKSMIGSDVKKMGGRTIPAHWEMIPHDKPGQKTVMDYLSIQFNVKIKSSFFSQQNMKRVR
ncbi:outer membrane lipoprotein-sorting protein [candidate division KSB1 bacterium]|nr:outer membrane lipoprotein-sorting protein [candidate division KSB1 bacterium]MBL7093807.1 outer membrane lipoprotein-sorting protein [candidate division KSB1 bacterium]